MLNEMAPLRPAKVEYRLGRDGVREKVHIVDQLVWINQGLWLPRNRRAATSPDAPPDPILNQSAIHFELPPLEGFHPGVGPSTEVIVIGDGRSAFQVFLNNMQYGEDNRNHLWRVLRRGNDTKEVVQEVARLQSDPRLLRAVFTTGEKPFMHGGEPAPHRQVYDINVGSETCLIVSATSMEKSKDDHLDLKLHTGETHYNEAPVVASIKRGHRRWHFSTPGTSK